MFLLMGYNPRLGGLKSFFVIRKFNTRMVCCCSFFLCYVGFFLYNFCWVLLFKKKNLVFFFIIGESYWFGYGVPFKIFLCYVIYVSTMMFVGTNIETHNKVLNGCHIGWCYIT
jgi:hypothetical protein